MDGLVVGLPLSIKISSWVTRERHNLWVTGNRHAIVGTKDGRLEVLDIGAGECVSSIDAHKGPVWAVTPLPDNSGLVSGSADHEAKFWEWEVPPPPSPLVSKHLIPTSSMIPI